jgi:integrase
VLPHDCRRFSVTQLIALGVDLSTVQKRNRHASLETTPVYALKIRESDQAAAEVMGRLLRPALLMLEAPGEGSAGP